MTKTCNMRPMKRASIRTVVNGRIFFILLYYIKKMDYQGIGMLSVVAAFMAIFVYVLMSRSKASNTNANLVPEIEMKEE